MNLATSSLFPVKNLSLFQDATAESYLAEHEAVEGERYGDDNTIDDKSVMKEQSVAVRVIIYFII